MTADMITMDKDLKVKSMTKVTANYYDLLGNVMITMDEPQPDEAAALIHKLEDQAIAKRIKQLERMTATRRDSVSGLQIEIAAFDRERDALLDEQARRALARKSASPRVVSPVTLMDTLDRAQATQAYCESCERFIDLALADSHLAGGCQVTWLKPVKLDEAGTQNGATSHAFTSPT